MSRVRCTCGVLLSLPPGILTMRCPRCYATVVCPQTRQLSPISTNGKKRAVLIGISYQGQPNSVNYQSAFNVWWMTQFLVRFLGFPRGSVVVLSDVQFQASKEPTKENIRSAFESLMDDCQQGDSLVFFCSGRDTQGRISAAEIYDAIVKPLPRGAKLHAIIDTCRGGTFPGLPFVYKMNNNQGNTWERVDQQTSTADQCTSGGTAICFSTGEDTTASTSDDVSGALTSSFIGAVKMERNLTYVRLLQSIHTKCCETQNRLNRSESSNTSSVLQVPQLSSSEPLDITSTLSI